MIVIRIYVTRELEGLDFGTPLLLPFKWLEGLPDQRWVIGRAKSPQVPALTHAATWGDEDGTTEGQMDR